MPHTLELGLHSFGDIATDIDGTQLTHAEVIRNVIEEAVLADEVGVDFFGIGEHHRADYAVSAPEIVLAIIAGRTRLLRLTTAVTLLSTDDPVRLFQRFATLDAATHGRAECVVGRGWFAESFALFGYERVDSETLFEEKLGLFTRLVRQGRAPARKGSPASTMPALSPPLAGKPFRTWVAVGSSLDSVLRAARYDCPMMLAVIGGPPERFAPFAELYREACTRLARAPREIGIHSVGFVAETDAQAREMFWPPYKRQRDELGRERRWPPIDKATFDAEVEGGSLYVGSPETVARKISKTVQALGATRFALKYSIGCLAHERLLGSIELYGRRVIPMVRDILNHGFSSVDQGKQPFPS